MSLTVLLTSNFQIQYDPAEYSGPGEISGVQTRAEAFATGCEPDYVTLSGWFGVAVGEGFGPSNRVIITLTKSLNGAVNSGYSTSQPNMWVNPQLGSSDDRVLGFFAAEMIEILMSFKGPWNRRDSGGEGLSRVAAQLLHPQFPKGFVNAWLASDPTADTTSAVADSEFRKDWVSQNFTGGPLKAGGSVNGDDDSYSFGCAMLFIYYLKSQLGFSMPQIVQNGGATLADTYQALTNGQTKGFWEFKSLLAQHFPISVQSPTDDPFPLYESADLGGVDLASAPAAVSRNPNRIDVFYRGPNNHLWTSWWDGGPGWSAPADLGGVDLASGPGVVARGPHRIDVLYMGPNNHLWVSWWDGGPGWSAPADLGGVSLTSEPAAVSRIANRIDVFYRGPNNHLWLSSTE